MNFMVIIKMIDFSSNLKYVAAEKKIRTQNTCDEYAWRVKLIVGL